MVTAITFTQSDEAIGAVRAAQAVGIPIVVSFTVDTDGSIYGTSQRSPTRSEDELNLCMNAVTCSSVCCPPSAGSGPSSVSFSVVHMGFAWQFGRLPRRTVLVDSTITSR